MKKRNIYRLIGITAILILLFTGIMQGQPPLPGGHGQNGNNGPGGAAPLDGGSLFLLLGSLGYGSYKVIRANKGRKDY